MSESIELVAVWGTHAYRYQLLSRGFKKCKQCESFTPNQSAHYCTHHLRVGTWASRNRKGLATGRCLDCGKDMREGLPPLKAARVRAFRCPPCNKKWKLRLAVENAHLKGETKLTPRYRRKCQYADCSNNVAGGGVAIYCHPHKRSVEREKRAVAKEQLRQNNIATIDLCRRMLAEIASGGEIGRSEMAKIKRISTVLGQLSMDPDLVKKRKRERAVAR